MMRTRTQSKGQGVSGFEGRLQRLKPLAKTTIARRKRLPNLSSDTTPRRSNLTMTGSMLKAISHKPKTKTLRFYIKGARNRDKAEYVSKARPFFNFSKSEVRKLLTLYKQLTGGK